MKQVGPQNNVLQSDSGAIFSTKGSTEIATERTYVCIKQPGAQRGHRRKKRADILRRRATMLLILLIVLILAFGYGGYRVGPGWGYYGGGSVSLILTIILILVLLRVI